MTRIVGGFIGGLIIGLFGVIITMHVLSSDITDKQAAAYDEGLKKGLEMATADSEGVGIEIGDHFNSQMANENEALSNQLGNVKVSLQVLLSRDDLPPAARDQIAEIVNQLE